MKQTNIEKLNDLFEKVSDPDSEAYGQHVTQEFLDSLTMPKAESIAAVRRFVNESFRIELGEPVHGYYTISAPVYLIEKALRCDIQVWFEFFLRLNRTF